MCTVLEEAVICSLGRERGMTESWGNSKDKSEERVGATERKVMFMASLQVQQPLGQDSVISLTEMERCQCQNRSCYPFLSLSLSLSLSLPEVNNLESFAESKQTAGWMRATQDFLLD